MNTGTLTWSDTENKADYEAGSVGVNATAGRDVTLTAGETYRFVDETHQHKGKSGMLSSKTYITRDILSETTAQAATLSGDTATVLAGRDITLQGSNLVATNDVNLAAQGNITIGTAQETSQEEHLRQVRPPASSAAAVWRLYHRQQE